MLSVLTPTHSHLSEPDAAGWHLLALFGPKAFSSLLQQDTRDTCRVDGSSLGAQLESCTKRLHDMQSIKVPACPRWGIYVTSPIPCVQCASTCAVCRSITWRCRGLVLHAWRSG